MKKTNVYQNNKKRRRKHRRQLLRRRLCILFFLFLSGALLLAGKTIFLSSLSDNDLETGSAAPLSLLKNDGTAHLIAMNGLSQEGIPTGCEAVSTVTVLQYFGISITPEAFIDGYLPTEEFYYKNDVLYGPNPSSAFCGSPYESGSLGCFPPVCAQAVSAMKEDGYPGCDMLQVQSLLGRSLTDLSREYIARDIPVLIWVTIDMEPSSSGMTYCLADGSSYTWQAGEHCMVLCGSDSRFYYLKDPLSDGKTVAFRKDLVQQRYRELGQQALVIERL